MYSETDVVSLSVPLFIRLLEFARDQFIDVVEHLSIKQDNEI